MLDETVVARRFRRLAVFRHHCTTVLTPPQPHHAGLVVPDVPLWRPAIAWQSSNPLENYEKCNLGGVQLQRFAAERIRVLQCHLARAPCSLCRISNVPEEAA